MHLLLVVLLASIALLSPAGSAMAATPIGIIAGSPDVTVDLSGATASDENLPFDDLAGTIVVLGPPDIPATADLDAYHHAAGNDLFSLDTTVVLPGGLTVEPRDVVRWDSLDYTLDFDGSAEGVSGDARIDAISIDAATGDLLLSFDVSVDLSGLDVADEDLVAFDGSVFSLYFDGSAHGVSEALDLDAAHYVESNGNLALSFDGSGVIGGIAFDDEDVLEFEPGSGLWTLAFDGSVEHAGWAPADLDALYLLPVPEPSLASALFAGSGFLAILRRQQWRRAERPRSGQRQWNRRGPS